MRKARRHEREKPQAEHPGDQLPLKAVTPVRLTTGNFCMDELVNTDMDRLLLVVFFLGKTVLTSDAPLCNLWKDAHPLWTTNIYTETFCIDSNRTGRVFIKWSQDAVMVFNSPCVYGAYASSVSGAQCEQRTEDCVVPFEDMERKAQGHNTYDISHYVQNKSQRKCNGKLLNSLQLQYTCVPRTMFQDMCNAVFRDENHIFLWKSEAAKECQCEFTINAGTQGHLELLYLKTQEDSTIFRVSVDGSVLNKTHTTPVPWIKPHMESSVIEADYGVQAGLSLTVNEPTSGFCRRKTSAVSDSTPSPSTTKSAVPDLGSMQSQVSFATDLGISLVASTSTLVIVLFIIGAVFAVKRCRPARRDRDVEAVRGAPGQRRTREGQHHEHLQLQTLSLEHETSRDPPSLPGPSHPVASGLPDLHASHEGSTYPFSSSDQEHQELQSRDECTPNASGDPAYVEPLKPTRGKLRRRTKRKGYRHSRADASNPSSMTDPQIVIQGISLRNDEERSIPSSSSFSLRDTANNDSGVECSPNHSDSDRRGNSTGALENCPRGAVSGVRNSLIGTKHGTIRKVYKQYNHMHGDDSKVGRHRSRPSRIANKFSSMIKRVSSDDDKELSRSTHKTKNALLKNTIKFNSSKKRNDRNL